MKLRDELSSKLFRCSGKSDVATPAVVISAERGVKSKEINFDQWCAF